MPNVKVYSTPTCPFCKKTKEFLKANNIGFKDINVSADPAALNEMVEKSGQTGVPVIDIDGTIIVGYDIEALEKALGIGESATKPSMTTSAESLAPKIAA